MKMKTAIYDKAGKKIAGDESLYESLPAHILRMELPLIENGGLYSRLTDGTISLIFADEKVLEGFAEKKDESKRLTKNEFVKNLLYGVIGNDVKSIGVKYGFYFDDIRRVFVAEINEDVSTYVATLEEILDDEGITVIGIDSHRIAVVCREGESDTAEMADAIHSTFNDLNTDCFIGVSCSCDSAQGLSVAFEQALSAIRLGKKLSYGGGVWFFSDILPELILSELPKDATLELKERSEQISKSLDREAVEIAQEFFKHNLNVSETAKSCNYHRNSLSYKLDKIQKETGLNLRNFNEAVALRLYIAANKVLK